MINPQTPKFDNLVAQQLARISAGLMLLAEGVELGEIDFKRGAASLEVVDDGFFLISDLCLAYTAKGKAHKRRAARKTARK